MEEHLQEFSASHVPLPLQTELLVDSTPSQKVMLQFSPLQPDLDVHEHESGSVQVPCEEQTDELFLDIPKQDHFSQLLPV